ncbi:MAG: hypothetical protein P8X55_14300 [Desulfosarcinaceae bacterium]
MKLDVPFIPDSEYADYLAGLGDEIHAVHFSLYDPELSDARIRLKSVEIETLIDLLRKLPGPRKYLLANGRFHRTDHYAPDGGMNSLLDRLERLRSSGVLDGLIFSDAYLLMALSDAAPDLAGRLEAVPSINFGMDSIRKVQSVLDLILNSRFRLPGKIALDRSVNRDPDALSGLAKAVRRHYPEAKVELLVNEGCLSRCPFRRTHEALIACANAGMSVDSLRLNRDLGCMRILSRSPHRILASPFIRPEDMWRYKNQADIFKVCGRTLGQAFLMRAVNAYRGEKYAGNLLDLLDASHWMAEKWDLRNEALPEDFIQRMAACDQHCEGCPTCREMFRRFARPRLFHLPQLG